jgi:hypothetical protein
MRFLIWVVLFSTVLLGSPTKSKADVVDISRDYGPCDSLRQSANKGGSLAQLETCWGCIVSYGTLNGDGTCSCPQNTEPKSDGTCGCGGGLQYNPASQSCCPNGAPFNPNTKLCCGKGTKFNAVTGLCWVPLTNPVGGSGGGRPNGPPGGNLPPGNGCFWVWEYGQLLDPITLEWYFGWGWFCI